MSSFVSGLRDTILGQEPAILIRVSAIAQREGGIRLADATIALISGGLSGGFALAGVGLSNWTSARRERRVFGRETALELAGMERLVWGDSWIELKAHLQRQEDRLAVAGLPEDLIDEFRAISTVCWRNQHESVENSGGKDRGMSIRLVEARQAVHSAARAELLRRGSRRSRRALRAEASALVEAALPE